MSFQAYLDNIQSKISKTPSDFKAMATEMGFAGPARIAAGIKAAQITDWLKAEFDLGASLGGGDAMAIVALLKGKKD